MRMKRVKAALAGVFAVAMATTGISAAAYGSSAVQSSPKASAPISVLYSYNYVFDSDAQANKWWASLAKQWAKADPSVKLTLLGTGGTDIDEMNKAAVLFRSPAETPCVIQLPTTYVGEFAGSGYLQPLNSYVKGSAFWNGMPKSVQEMSTINGQVDAVNAGNNDSGIVYNKVFLEKAGIKLPWYPKTWQDILNVAKAVKKANPKVYALWLGAGVGAGATNVLQGIGNLIDGSTNPLMFDSKTGKWVVNSPGLRATLQFYKTLDTEGLGAPTSQLFPSDSVGNPPLLFSKSQLAIAIGSNWYTGSFLPAPVGGAPWPQANKDVGVAPIPTEFGQAPGSTTTLGGWAWAVSKACQNKAAAWKLITLAQQPANQLLTAIWSGFIPPDSSLDGSPAFIKSSLYQQQFGEYAVNGIALPNNVNFPVYARALNTVTGNFAINPGTSISSALSTLSSLVTEQLGSNSVETK
ncbi:MAG: extracellular solute-binding protein [Acidimicrobiales bacterium]|jgi:multiple sugar transport system substrate-binding protein